MAIPEVELSTGAKISMLGYGTGTLWMKRSDEIDRKTVDGIKEAIALGYRHLDGAQMYNTEAELGLAIEESGIPRSDLWLTTKAVSPLDIEGGLRKSLERLKTDYVDLYLIHEPFTSSSDQVLQEAWKSMEKCRELGLARSIGVSNFSIPHFETIFKVATVKPAVNQIEFHAYLQSEQLVQYLKEQGIAIEAYGPLTPITKARPGPIDDVCRRLAEKYGVRESVLLLRWVIDQGIVAITTSSKKERLEEYLKQVPSLQLTKEDMAEITSSGKGKDFRQFMFNDFPNGGFKKM